MTFIAEYSDFFKKMAEGFSEFQSSEESKGGKESFDVLSLLFM